MTDKADPTIFYVSEGEQSAIMPLSQLIDNFNAGNGWQFGTDEQGLRSEIAGRAWYEGMHEHGRYLVLDIAAFGLRRGDA